MRVNAPDRLAKRSRTKVLAHEMSAHLRWRALSIDIGTGYMTWVFAHALRFLRTLLLFQLLSAQQEGPVFLHFFVVCIRSENQPVRMLLVFLAAAADVRHRKSVFTTKDGFSGEFCG